MNWVQLGNFDFQGADGTAYWVLDEVSDRAGTLWVFLPPFSLSRPDENVFIGIANRVSNTERPEFIGQSVAPIADYGQYLRFEIPAVESPVLGIRGHSSILGMNPRVGLCEECRETVPEDEVQPTVPVESLLLPVPFLRAIRLPEMKQPTTIHRIGDQYWVFCFGSRAVRFDLDWNFIGEIGPQFARPLSTNQDLDRVWDTTVDTASDQLFLSCSSRNVVRAYRLSSFTDAPELLGNIPAIEEGAISWAASSVNRPLSDGYLRFAAGVAVLPNGNVAVASRQGVGASGEGSPGAIVEYTPEGQFVQLLVSAVGDGGLIENADYRDWFGKLRWMDGKLWAVSFALRMVVAWELTVTAGEIVGLVEVYRRFMSPSGLPSVAGWTPHGLALHNGQLLTTHNANNGVNPGLYKGVYALDLNEDALRWFAGQQIELGEQAYGEHPALFANPHDVLPLGNWRGRQVFAVADYGDDKITILPQPEFIQDFLPYLTVPIASAPQGSEIVSPPEVAFDSASQTAQVPLYRLTPSVPT